MKTRIKITTNGLGESEYESQYREPFNSKLNIVMHWVSSLLSAMALTIIKAFIELLSDIEINFFWVIIASVLLPIIIFNILFVSDPDFPYYRIGVFYNLDSAKKSIDDFIKEKEDKQVEKYNETLKNTIVKKEYIKHP